ncbi:MAG: MotA/TolQ/ExbB proton channel family protein [Gammaproteobacteria bacterium]|nr:MotA/TolQ/ExbB proton channel family protein [Gammaproteobacteria bacterium]
MKQQGIISDFIFQVFALIISVIVVHAVYVAVIRPNADSIMEQQLILQEADPEYVAERSLYVVMRDYEQETCIILMFWAMSIIGLKIYRNRNENRLLQRSLLTLSEGMSILPEDARDYARPVQALPPEEREFLLPRALLAALHRFGSTRSIPDVASVIRDLCTNESDRLESELTIVRYIAWAIPSIGFLGTVRGIGEALGQAHRAVSGDIVGVTVSLGVAFNSTFIALVVSILIMFILYQLQLLQDRLVLDTQNYCDDNLIRHLQVPEKDDHA